jgi:hypothetical protein
MNQSPIKSKLLAGDPKKAGLSFRQLLHKGPFLECRFVYSTSNAYRLIWVSPAGLMSGSGRSRMQLRERSRRGIASDM